MTTSVRRPLVALIEHVRAELSDAIVAIEDDNVDRTVEILRSVADRIHSHVEELRS